MKQNVLAVIMYTSLITNILGGLAIYAQAKNNKQLIYDLNVSQTAFAISQDNAERLQVRVDELEGANMCLLKAMDNSTAIKAIKRTPLPPMVR